MEWSPRTTGSSRGRGRSMPSGMTPPSQPAVIVAAVIGGGGDLTWDPMFGAVDYRIEVGTSPGASDALVTHTGSSTPAYTLSLGPGTYYVRIYSVGPDGGDWTDNYGPASDEVTVTL